MITADDSTITVGNSAPLDVEPLSGDSYRCWENYPKEACDIVIGSPPVGTTVASHGAGSCASLVPEPRMIISSIDFLDTSGPLENLIVNYDSSGLQEVSCLLALETPSF